MFEITFTSLVLISIAEVVVLIFLSERSSRIDIFSPPFVFAMLLFVGVVLKTLLMSTKGDAVTAELLNGEQLDILVYGHLAVMVSVVMFLLGYDVLGSRYKLRIFNSPMRTWNLSVFVLPGFTIMSLVLLYFYYERMDIIQSVLSGSVSSKRYYFTEDGGRSSLTYLSWGSDILFALFLAKFSYVRRLSSVPYYYWGALLVALATMFFSGNRLALILYLIMVLIVAKYLSLYRFKLPTIRILLIVMLLVGGMGVLRDIGYGNQDRTIQFMSIAGDVLKTSGDHILYKPYLMAIDKTALIVERVDEYDDLLFGSSLFALFVAPIPRVIWEGKPSVRVGQYVGKNIYGRTNKAGVPPGFIGELFLNFWWFGIVFGMLLYGWLSSVAYNSLLFSRRDAYSVGLYSIIVCSFVITLMSSDLVGSVSQFFRIFIPFYVFSHCLHAGK